MALIIYLLEQSVLISLPDNNESEEMLSSNVKQQQHKDMDWSNWYQCDYIFENLRTTIPRIIFNNELTEEVSPIAYNYDSDLEWDNSEVDTVVSDITVENSNILMLPESVWDGQEEASGRDLMVFVPQNTEEPDSPASTSGTTTTVLALPSSTTSMEVDIEPNAAQVPAIRIPPLPSPLNYPAITAGNELERWPMWNYPSTSTDRPSTSTDLVPSTSKSGRKTYNRRRQTLKNSTSGPSTLKLNESIISLLLKLHSQLSGVPDSFNLTDEQQDDSTDESLIGDGPYFVGKLLNKIAAVDTNCKQCIQETRMKLWPTQEERDAARKQRENKEREERRRRAKERQQKLMAEFATKQRQFMEKAMETDDNSDGLNDEVLVSKQEYDCVICNQSTPSTEDKPMGLVVLIQATSVVGHRRRFGQPERSVLPTCDEEKEQLRRDDILTAEFDRRVEELDRQFDPVSDIIFINKNLCNFLIFFYSNRGFCQ